MPLAPTTLQAPACHAHLIAPGVLSGLEGIRYHDEGPLTRWLMSGADVHPGADTHVAVHRVDAVVHRVDAVADAERDYCDVHEHTVPELNLILPITDLIYDIVLGDDRYEVHGPASVFIPAGLSHSANVRAGTGFFVAIVLGVQEYDTAFGEA